MPEGELYDIVQSVDEFCTNSYKEGLRDGEDKGYINGKRDAFDDSNAVEKLCTEYTVIQFADCKTLSDFQDKLKEITNRSYNFMT